MHNYSPRWSCRPVMSMLLVIVLHNILHIICLYLLVLIRMYIPITSHYLSMQCWHCIYWNVFPFLIIQLHAPIVYNWPDHQLKISILPDWQQHLLPNVPLGILPNNGYSTVYGMYVCMPLPFKTNSTIFLPHMDLYSQTVNWDFEVCWFMFTFACLIDNSTTLLWSIIKIVYMMCDRDEGASWWA